MPSKVLALVDITEFQTFEAYGNLGQSSVRYNKNTQSRVQKENFTF
jgi:hypothetical protein